MIRCLRRQSIRLLLVLGLWASTQGLLSAQNGPPQPSGPVLDGFTSLSGAGSANGPGYPLSPPILPMPPVQPAQPTTPGQPTITTPPTQPAAPAHAGEVTNFPAPFTDPGIQDGSFPGHGGGGHGPLDPIGTNDTVANVGMQGRADFNNRFNIFDNTSALPNNRVWVGFQNLDGYQTGFGNSQNYNLPLTQRRTVDLTRGGAEVSLGTLFSLTVQGEYVSSVGPTNDADAWSNPMFTLKWAAIYTESTVISPVLGFAPSTGQSDGQLHDKTSRIYPGFLFYEALNDSFIVQGGAQFGIAAGAAANTFDFGVSLGWWLFRDPSMDALGRRTDPFPRTALPFCTGIMPQVEIFGTRVINGASEVPLDPNIPGQLADYTGFREGENIYDVTLGGRIYFIDRICLGLAYSFPITGVYVRKNEFQTTLSLNW